MSVHVIHPDYIPKMQKPSRSAPTRPDGYGPAGQDKAAASGPAARVIISAAAREAHASQKAGKPDNSHVSLGHGMVAWRPTSPEAAEGGQETSKGSASFDDTGSLTYPDPDKKPVSFDDTGNLSRAGEARFDDTGSLTYPDPDKKPVSFDDTGNLSEKVIDGKGELGSGSVILPGDDGSEIM